jgi:hypothetical protein
MTKSRPRKKRVRGHIVAGPVQDAELTAMSCSQDAAADREWFRQHPGVAERTRPATFIELAALGLPLGTMVVVTRHRDGVQSRAFVLPPPA